MSAPPRPTRPVVVWDLPTRVFHWTVVGAVLLGWLTAEAPGIWFALHKLAGFVILVALLFRVVWGIGGSRHSRFSDFIYSWPAVRAQVADAIRLRARPHVGHTPAGGWMIVALLLTLATIAISGLFAAARDVAGPLAAVLPAALSHLAKEVHETAFNILLFLVVVHVCGVVAEAALTGARLVRAMWTGRKDLTPEQAAGEGRLVAVRWAVAAAVAAAVLVLGAFG
ncbi:MAG: cytochrome b/b6 domain-containing protein [Rhodospirillales bacterium]